MCRLQQSYRHLDSGHRQVVQLFVIHVGAYFNSFPLSVVLVAKYRDNEHDVRRVPNAQLLVATLLCTREPVIGFVETEVQISRLSFLIGMQIVVLHHCVRNVNVL
jgi:hypothetical protein